MFSEVLGGKRKGPQKHEEHLQNKRRKQTGKDEEYYIPYRPKDFNSEKGCEKMFIFIFYFYKKYGEFLLINNDAVFVSSA